MASTNKTEYLGLNKWILSDKPRMEDFNEDNRILDEKLHQLSAEKANYTQSTWQPVILSGLTSATFSNCSVATSGNLVLITLRGDSLVFDGSDEYIRVSIPYPSLQGFLFTGTGQWGTKFIAPHCRGIDGQHMFIKYLDTNANIGTLRGNSDIRLFSGAIFITLMYMKA